MQRKKIKNLSLLGNGRRVVYGYNRKCNNNNWLR